MMDLRFEDISEVNAILNLVVANLVHLTLDVLYVLL